MKPRDIAVVIARTRIALGLGALAAPGMVGRAMFGRGGDGTPSRMLGRMVGGRDLALGLGVVIALDRGAPVRGWLEAAALADGLDLVSTLLVRDDLSPAVFAGTAVTAGAAAAAGLWLSTKLDPAPPAEPGHPEATVTGHSQEPPA